MRAAELHAGLWISLLALAGCGPEPPVNAVPVLPPAIEEPLAVGPVVVPKPASLAPNARVQWPAFDGDAFWVGLPDGPGGPLMPADVRARYVLPFLDALGVLPGEVTLVDPSAGVPQPAVAPLALVRLAAAPVDRTPTLMRKTTKRMLAALGGESDPDAASLFARAEGRTPAAALADLGRREIRYSFVQAVNGVPVEFTIVVASRWDGRSVSGVRGTVLTKWTVVNAASLSAAEAVDAAIRAIGARTKLVAVAQDGRAPRPVRVLLPYGRDSSGRAQLRQAWRIHLTGDFGGLPTPLLAWIDAADGTLLKLKPLLSAVGATGLAWSRDPRDTAEPAQFEVDAAQGGVYTLQRQNAFFRLDFAADGYNAEDVTVPATGPTADFDTASIGDATAALCGTNKAFQQVHAFATLWRLRDRILAQGIYEPYPPFGGLAVWVEAPSAGCTSWAAVNSVMFGFCPGATTAGCPGPRLNVAHDVTMLAHELGHTATKRLMEYRRLEDCPTCPISPGLGALEDLADFWASHLTWTNCIAGWAGQDTGGTGLGLNCQRHDQGSGFPRFLDLPADRFPDKRVNTTVGSATNPCVPTANVYCNGQIAAIALWEARLGLRSRSPLLGVPEFGARIQTALRNLIITPELDQSSLTDTKVYRLLQGILLELTKEYASSSAASMTNKALAGFARAGLFLAPYQCLATPTAANTQGGTTQSTTEPTCAPGHPADAIIDVDDRIVANDPVIFGVKYRQSDFIRPTGRIPTFHVWTGARYHLNLATGAVNLAGTAPCHKAFMVELSTTPTFPVAETFSSGWKNVTSTTSSNASACHGTWTPSKAKFPREVVGRAIYYRVKTRPAGGGTELISTQPGAGIVGEIPPPFVLITADGLPEY